MSPDSGSEQTIAGWRLVRRLGQGTHGTVHVAARIGSDEAFALKLVALPAGDTAAREQFLRQARAVARLAHADIVALLDSGIDGTIGWLAMELVPGTDLVRYTEPGRLLPEPLVLRVGERIARALAHAHALGFVHRDVKPANVLVHWPSDTVKLADLGLARAPEADATRTGVVPGTPAYMAPEQLAGALPDAAGLLYPAGDVAALAECLARIVGDAALRARLADGAWAAAGRQMRWRDTALAFLAALRAGAAA